MNTPELGIVGIDEWGNPVHSRADMGESPTDWDVFHVTDETFKRALEGAMSSHKNILFKLANAENS